MSDSHAFSGGDHVSAHNNLPLLTSPNLRTITPVFNKTGHIKTFIESQVYHKKAHASEGRAFEFSWAPGNRTPQKPKKFEHGPIGDFGFGTPVLKPRTMRKGSEVNERRAKSPHHKPSHDYLDSRQLHSPTVHKQKGACALIRDRSVLLMVSAWHSSSKTRKYRSRRSS